MKFSCQNKETERKAITIRQPLMRAEWPAVGTWQAAGQTLVKHWSNIIRLMEITLQQH
jgi:hypothetical protein